MQKYFSLQFYIYLEEKSPFLYFIDSWLRTNNNKKHKIWIQT